MQDSVVKLHKPDIERKKNFMDGFYIVFGDFMQVVHNKKNKALPALLFKTLSFEICISVKLSKPLNLCRHVM